VSVSGPSDTATILHKGIKQQGEAESLCARGAAFSLPRQQEPLWRACKNGTVQKLLGFPASGVANREHILSHKRLTSSNVRPDLKKSAADEVLADIVCPRTSYQCWTPVRSGRRASFVRTDTIRKTNENNSSKKILEGKQHDNFTIARRNSTTRNPANKCLCTRAHKGTG
jgi:hypothetical protein